MHGNGDITIYLFVGFFVAVVIFIVISQIQAKRRTKALISLAPTIGFTFEGDDWSDPSCAPRLQMPLFDRGHSQRFRNIMTGQVARLDTSLFDYWFTTGGGKSSHTWTQTVVAFTQDLWLPVFELRPEGVLDRVADVFTHKDIDFESHPIFSHRFLLRGLEVDKVRQLFAPPLLTFREGLSNGEKWHLEGDGYTLILYRSDVIVDAEEYPSLLEQTTAMAKAFFNSCGRTAPK
jgi:hypothetical protein